MILNNGVFKFRTKSLYINLTPFENILLRVLGLDHVLKCKLTPEEFFLSFHDYFRKKLNNINDEINIKVKNDENFQEELVNKIFYKTFLELSKNVYMKNITKKGTVEYNEIFIDMIDALKVVNPQMLKILEKEVQ